MRIKVTGRWRQLHPSSTNYLGIVATASPDLDWFMQPSVTADRVVLESRKRVRATITSLRLEVREHVSRGHGTIAISLAANPTRTLAHLLPRFEPGMDFVGFIDRLSPAEFFSVVSDVRLSRDGNDNWIADPDLAFSALGRDPFSSFLPIYARRLVLLTLQLVAPTLGDEHAATEDGAHLVIENEEIEMRLAWGEAKAPQIESYFERFHSQPLGALRAAAQSALAGLDRVVVRPEVANASFEREQASFRILTPLPDNRDLAIYAKADDRIRFEVRKRRSAGRYSQSGAASRLITMMNDERAALLLQNWSSAGSLFDEGSEPHFPDLLTMIDSVNMACRAASQALGPCLLALLADGGIVGDGTNEPLIRELKRMGIVERLHLRRRDQSLPRRYVLASPYRDVQEHLLTAFADRRADEAEPSPS